MSHMQPEIVYVEFQIIRNTDEGDIATPYDHSEYRYQEEAAQAYGVSAEDVEHRMQWGARLSAPGYLDCTEWATFDTKQEAAQYLLDTYGAEFGDRFKWEAELEEIASKA